MNDMSTLLEQPPLHAYERAGIQLIEHAFFQALSVRTGLGRVAVGYFRPFRTLADLEPNARADATKVVCELLNDHAIVTGDMNSGVGVLRQFLEARGLNRHVTGHFPSYLFSAPDKNDASAPPCFDGVIWDAAAIDKLGVQPLVDLPGRVKGNPRALIAEHNLLSDHVPVATCARRGGQVLRVFSWNIADPAYWGKYYPGAADGFDPGDEASRQKRIREYLSVQLGRHDIIGLQEVPADMVGWLNAVAAGAGYETQAVAMRHDTDSGAADDPTISRLMMLARPSIVDRSAA